MKYLIIPGFNHLCIFIFYVKGFYDIAKCMIRHLPQEIIQKLPINYEFSTCFVAVLFILVLKDSTDCSLSLDLKNQPIVSSCVTHILPFYGYFKGQEHICFNPTSWHLVTYNFL